MNEGEKTVNCRVCGKERVLDIYGRAEQCPFCDDPEYDPKSFSNLLDDELYVSEW
jgi:hypothetical protein